jgi:hypothetical protein
MSYLREETFLGGRSIKWQNGTDRHTDTPTDRQIKKGPCRPLPFGLRVVGCRKIEQKRKKKKTEKEKRKRKKAKERK